MKRFLILTAILLNIACTPEDGLHKLYILSTNDVHGAWFDSTYVGGGRVASLMAVNSYVDSIRLEAGEDNVLLIDAGDILQGDNAPYYYNYVASGRAHLYPKIASYMGYDVVVAGNHDIETGHPVYDRVNRQLKRYGIPFLAGNAIDVSSGKPYFQSYSVIHKAGLKVLVLGYTNANIKAWLQEELWKGMDFKSLLPLVQDDVNALTAKIKPQVVVVAVHSGTGEGDGSILESQALDLLESLEGVDVVVGAHDHRQLSLVKEGKALVNAGTKAKYLGNCIVDVEMENGTVKNKQVRSYVEKIDPERTDAAMHQFFADEFEEVKAFTLREVGVLAKDLRTRDAYMGMSDYINLVHTVQIGVPEARISFAAPLTYDGTVKAGTVVFNDMFTIYPFENQMFVVNMTGEEIRNYLEFSYDGWIQTPGDHILRIIPRDDSRYEQSGWSFAGRPYNFDSAAGLIYTVDVTKQAGSRVNIASFADGSSFEYEKTYPVAMTSYRASGGGGIMPRGAGITADELEERIVAKYPEIRELIYQFISEHKTIVPEIISDPDLLGEWHFVPETCKELLEKDMELIFGN